MNSRMPPKWVYYAAANFGVVGMALLTPLLGPPRLPTALGLTLLIVCLVAANLAAWYIQRARAHLAVATDQPVANRKVKMKPIQLMLIACGVLLLALTLFTPSSQGGLIWGIVASILMIGSGIVLGVKRKPKPSA